MEDKEGQEQEVSWQRYVAATSVCLGALLAALAAGAWPEVATVLFFAAFIAGIWYPLQETAGELAEGGLDVDFLMILVALGAWGVGHPGEGAALLVLFNGSRAMEAYARNRTRRSIADLTRDLPSTATRLDGREQVEVPIAEIRAGDVLLIRPGDRFPVDSEVVEGAGTLDLSALTGESEPVNIEAGIEVPSGAVNGNGRVTVRALKPSAESAYQKIMKLIESAPARRSPAQVLSDRVGRYFTVGILSASVLGFLAWWLLAGLSFQEAGYRAMVLLVAGSPCALVLSIPSAILAAISSGARRGILFNGGAGLASLASVRTVAFDKTGTLTTGQPSVVEAQAVVEDPLHGESQLLAIALELASSSTHPASRAILRHLQEKGVESRHEIEDIHEVPGEGVRGALGGTAVRLGRPHGCEALRAEEAQLSKAILEINGRPAARFYLTETVRPGAAETVAALRLHGLTPMIISGDAQPAVDRVAAEVGIKDARGELKPEAKWQAVQDASAHGGVMMIGDGVNDAPALSVADVAVAMGLRGSAATLAQADLILVRDYLPDLVSAMELGDRTKAVIRQNLTISIGAATILVLFAMAGSLPLILGVFGHEGGTVLVVLNSLRLLLGKGTAAPHGAHTAAAPVPAREAETAGV